jgi:glyoxylase-like metal-dependent hydrolase (beta-lactamase superfamily II)
MGAAPIQAQLLAENLTLLSGPGGNVVVLNGPDGKIVVDTFLTPAWPKLKAALDGLGNAPLKTVIDTHWHFDHTDNNANLHAAGASAGPRKHQDAHGRATRQCAFGFAHSAITRGCFAAADIQQQPKTAGQW